MSARRRLIAAGIASSALYLLFYYVPISAAHTVEVFPWRPLGDWRVASPAGLAALYAAILAALFALYAVALRAAGDPAEAAAARGAALAGAVLPLVVLLLLPSLLSKDVFDYMVQGRILAIHRANPFQTPADAFPQDEFQRAMGWPQFTSLYGPGWVSACGLLSWAAPGTVAGSLVVYKIAFGAVHLLNGVLIGALLRGWGRPPLAGQVAYLWNPLVVLQTGGEAHNDVFVVLWVLLGLLFAQRRASASPFLDEALGAVCLTVSVLLKYVTAPLLLLSLAVRWRERGGLRGLGRAAALGLVAGGVLLLGYLPYARGMDLLHFLRPYQHGSYQGSSLMVLHMALQKAAGGAEGGSSEAVGDAMLAASGLLYAILAAGCLWLALRVRAEEEVPRMGLWVLAFYLLAATALLRVSYGVWLVALAALIRPGLIRAAALILSASLFALEIYWVYAIRLLDAGTSLHRIRAAATVVAVGVPISYLLAGLVRRRRRAAA